MRAVIQRVKFAKVEVDGKVVGEIGPGLFTLLGVGHDDTREQVESLISKIIKLRVFEDEAGKMNLSVLEKKYAHLIVSQFTLYADTKKGNRPSFIDAAKPEIAAPLYNYAIEVSRTFGVPTAGGVFGADMKITLLNDGPVTLVLES